jgi:glutamyl-tRNA reductase
MARSPGSSRGCARSPVPLIGETQAQLNAIKRRELEWDFAKLSGLDERERRIVEALASHLVGKMLRAPI